MPNLELLCRIVSCNFYLDIPSLGVGRSTSLVVLTWYLFLLKLPARWPSVYIFVASRCLLALAGSIDTLEGFFFDLRPLGVLHRCIFILNRSASAFDVCDFWAFGGCDDVGWSFVRRRRFDRFVNEAEVISIIGMIILKGLFFSWLKPTFHCLSI